VTGCNLQYFCYVILIKQTIRIINKPVYLLKPIKLQKEMRYQDESREAGKAKKTGNEKDDFDTGNCC
jgi:hypothetical protein